MGQVLRFSEFAPDAARNADLRSKLIPIEFGVGDLDRAHCLRILARRGRGQVEVREMSALPDGLLYLMRLGDAIDLHRDILDQENLTDGEAASHIDRIQMLENLHVTLPFLEQGPAGVNRG